MRGDGPCAFNGCPAPAWAPKDLKLLLELYQVPSRAKKAGAQAQGAIRELKLLLMPSRALTYSRPAPAVNPVRVKALAIRLSGV